MHVNLQTNKIKMKKLQLVLCMALMAVMPCRAQQNVALFEFEVKAGTNLPLDSESGISNKLGVNLGLESRWNLKRLPMDVGAELYIGSAVRHAEDDKSLSNRTISLAVLSDYQINRGSKVSPFIGLGLGVANCQQIIGSLGDEATTLCIIPRVGVEFARHLRLTLDAHISKKYYSHVGLTIGYSFHSKK